MKIDHGRIFVMLFLLVGAVSSSPIYSLLISGDSKIGTKDIVTLSETDGCDDDDEDDEDEGEE